MPDPRLGVNLTRHVYEKQKEHPQATGELSGILNQVALAAKVVSREVNKAGLAEILGLTGEKNVQGEAVKKLDEFANDVFVAALDHSGHFCIMASEEMADPIPIPPECRAGRYAIAFDPLDGSSNIDVAVSVGTIFSILRNDRPDAETASAVLQRGSAQVAAGYVLYGTSVLLVLATSRGTDMYALDPGLGEFVLVQPGLAVPAETKTYSINEAYVNDFGPRGPEVPREKVSGKG